MPRPNRGYKIDKKVRAQARTKHEHSKYSTMRIYVCIKQVPDSEASISITSDTVYDSEVKYVVNPYDEFGVEQAIRLVEQAGKGEVIALCVGNAGAANALKAFMAMGVHRSVLITTDNQFTGSDVVAQALAKVIAQGGSADFVFTGKQTIDSEGMQTSYRLGAELGFPVVNGVLGFSMEGSTAVVQREIGGGARDYQLKAPVSSEQPRA